VRPAALEALLHALPPFAAMQARLQNFTAEANQTLLFPNAAGEVAGALLGLGSQPALHGFGTGATALPAAH
jgi:hypothetical protein